MNSPVFSIIIPTYNSEVTLSKALDSILNQTFNDYEVLIIDGLSRDKTESVARAYQNRSLNVKWFSEIDEGIYDAMNKGIRFAKGDWLYFLGSDDFLINKEVLNDVFGKIENSLCDVVYGNVLYAADNTLYDGEFTYGKLYEKNICHQSIFIKRTVFNHIGNFDKSYKIVADWHHNIRWFFNNKIKHQFIGLTIAEYSDGGFSSTNKDYKFLGLKNELFLRYGFFKLPLSQLITLTKKVIDKHKKRNNYLYVSVFFTLLLLLRAKKLLTNS